MTTTPDDDGETTMNTNDYDMSIHVRRLVLAARAVAFGDLPPGPDEIKELDAATEAFADLVPWEDAP